MTLKSCVLTNVPNPKGIKWEKFWKYKFNIMQNNENEWK